MKNFRRSLKYLWPQRRRLALAMVCVLLIAVLWGGGLGALLPGMKILISEEGLHGWAYNSVTRDRLGAKVVCQVLPPGQTVQYEGTERSLVVVLSIIAVDEDGAAAGLLLPSDWLVGISDDHQKPLWLRGELLARRIAELGPDQPVSLLVYRPHQRQWKTVSLRAQRAGLAGRALAWVAATLPQATTPRDRFHLLLWLLGFVLVITVLRNVLRFLEEYLAGTAVWRGMMDLRCENYDVVLRLPTTFFSEKGVSDSMSRFIHDTAELARGQRTLFGRTLVEPAKALAALTAAMLLSWRLTLLAMGAGPTAWLIIRKLGKTMRRASRRALQSWSAMLAVLDETLNGIRVVKAYTMEAAERKRFFRVNRRLYQQQEKMVQIDAASAPLVEVLGLIAAMGAVALAGYWVFNDVMDPESFIALMACLAALFDPVRKLAKVPARFQRSEAAAARIFELRDQEQEKFLPGAPALPRHSESISFRNVVFRYPSASQAALQDVDLEIAAGESVAVVGPNGSGKTTLVSLVPRLLDPTRGHVLIDGHDIASHSLRSLRRQIALVTQDAVIFNATVADNIAYGKRRARSGEIESAAQQAYVDEFVAELPNGYDTVVGEHGASLSGGQRQRIAIARAILRDPAILIFDEAMSQVDPDSERKVHRTLAKFRVGRTTLLVAHRLATVLQADRIVVMNEGRIVEVGRHEELLSRCGLYRQLYQTQLSPEEQ